MNNQAREAVERLKSAMAAGSRSRVNEACLKLIRLAPLLGAQWKSIATILQHNGEHRLAERAVSTWLRQSGEAPEVAFEFAAVSARAGRVNEASIQLDGISTAIPNPAAHAFMKGTLAINGGDFDTARDCLRKATTADPKAGQAWLALAMAGPVAAPDAEAIAGAATQMRTGTPADRSAWLYALGKVRDEDGDHDAAFRAFAEGAALMRSMRRYAPKADAAAAQARVHGWNAQPPPDGPPPRPIFVTGLPRSGTTLVEQILASHSAVDGGEELGLFRLLEQDMGGATHDHFAAFTARHGARPLRALYEHLLAERYPGTGRVVDKTLNASRTMGLIATLFPDAPILWVRRDPIDCAWSAYRSWFLRGLDWSWSLTDIAAHFRIEDTLFDHWTALLGERILVVDYADLVTDPEPQIARIIAHCGLALEPAQLNPHRTRRTVTTTSLAQVRQPIHTRAIGSSAPYRKYLEPFFAAYGWDGTPSR